MNQSFQETGWIVETKTEGRKRSYLITAAECPGYAEMGGNRL